MIVAEKLKQEGKQEVSQTEMMEELEDEDGNVYNRKAGLSPHCRVMSILMCLMVDVRRSETTRIAVEIITLLVQPLCVTVINNIDHYVHVSHRQPEREMKEKVTNDLSFCLRSSIASPRFPSFLARFRSLISAAELTNLP